MLRSGLFTLFETLGEIDTSKAYQQAVDEAVYGEELGFYAVCPAEHHFAVHVVAPVVADGAPVSSTRIRDAIAAGLMEEATALLGRPFAISGEVVSGAGRGRELEAPTANLACGSRFLPGRGVYVTEVRVDGEVLAAATNVGVRPTFGDDGAVTVETHVLDRQLSLYGKCIELAFLKRLRGEIRFDGPQALAAQIRQDLNDATRYFGGSS